MRLTIWRIGSTQTCSYVYQSISLFFLFTVYLRKVSDDACPLHLRLCAGPGEKALSLVLKENDTGDINVSFKCQPTWPQRASTPCATMCHLKYFCISYSGTLSAFLSCATSCGCFNARKRCTSVR